jgi:hypothetical protein
MHIKSLKSFGMKIPCIENSLGMGVWNSKKAILLLTLHLLKGNNATTHMHIASKFSFD